jgi:hypothetical protein
MKRLVLFSACLVLTAAAALAQGAPDRGDRRGRDGGVEDLLRDLGEMRDPGEMGGGLRGAAFFLRSGDASMAVRCDPQDSMKACVEAATMLMDKARGAATGASASKP